MDEAATNAIEHAYAGAPDREIELRFEDRPDELRIEIVDTGVTVDPQNVPFVDLDRYVTERRTGGLGVHLMEKIMDSVTFRRAAVPTSAAWSSARTAEADFRDRSPPAGAAEPAISPYQRALDDYRRGGDVAPALEKRMSELISLLDLSTTLSSSLAVDEILDAALLIVMGELRAPRGVHPGAGATTGSSCAPSAAAACPRPPRCREGALPAERRDVRGERRSWSCPGWTRCAWCASRGA